MNLGEAADDERNLRVEVPGWPGCAPVANHASRGSLRSYNPKPQFPTIGGINAHLSPSMGGLQATPFRLQKSQFDSC